MNEPININNAGLVLLYPYIPMLFERLGIIEDNAFVDQDSQLEAVHYLQYLVTGQSETEDLLLSLNKLLCGLPLTETVKNGIAISDEQKMLLDGMMEAFIDNWSAIGKTSIEGLRESFLIRDGVLEEKENYWEMTVEKSTFDILLDKLPYSISTIKYPWMIKPLNVSWR